MARQTQENRITIILLIAGTVLLAQANFLNLDEKLLKKIQEISTFFSEPDKYKPETVYGREIDSEDSANIEPAPEKNEENKADGLKGTDARLYGEERDTVNNRSRAMINFDKNLITVETHASGSTGQQLRNAVLTTMLTPEDPRAVDIASYKPGDQQGRPYLHGLIRNQHGHIINSTEMAKLFADYLVRHRKKNRSIRQKNSLKTISYVQFKMFNKRRYRRALRYSEAVDQYSKRYQISKSLVYSIMQVESNFDPYAVSPASAYGLMQIVPHSGGRDAYRFIHQYDKIPGKHYLFQTDNNIEMGIAYLHMIYYIYLADIKNPVSREYCTIAAYNTGIGNVLNTFSRNNTVAIRRINRLTPQAIYRHLRKFLPYAETRRYLHEVIRARTKYLE